MGSPVFYIVGPASGDRKYPNIMVINVIEDGDTRCEVYLNANDRAVISIGPSRGEPMETMLIQMDEEDLSAFIKMCRSVLKQITEINEQTADGNER